MPVRFLTKANEESSRPYLVTGRVTSWFDSTQVLGASTGACAPSVSSMEVRSSAASQGRARKSKLKAVCSSSGRRYIAKRSMSGSQISPTSTRVPG